MQKEVLHKKIYSDIVSKITNAVYKSGDLLPSENDLCATYTATRPTIRLALDRLVAEGYIEKERGRGSRVVLRKQALGILSIEGTTGGVGNTSLNTKMLQPIQVISQIPDVGFEVTLESEYYYFERLRIADGKPILVESTYIPSSYVPNFEDTDVATKGLFYVLKNQYGIHIKGGEQKIWSIAAPVYLSKILMVSAQSPLLHLKRRLDTDKQFHFYSVIFATTEAHCLQGKF